MPARSSAAIESSTSRYFQPIVTSRFFPVSAVPSSPCPSNDDHRPARKTRTVHSVLSDIAEADTVTNHFIQPSQEAGLHVDRTLLETPAFVCFANIFIDLYDRLWFSKPILIQEHVNKHPWKLLVAVMLLNKTAGRHSIPIFWETMRRWPTPEAMSKADAEAIKGLLQPLGLQKTRAQRLIKLSQACIDDPPRQDNLRPSSAYMLPYADYKANRLRRSSDVSSNASHPHQPRQRYPSTPISHLPGSGPYAMDSYRIFCMDGDEWKTVMPADKELVRYLKWKWAVSELKWWDPVEGVVGEVQIHQMEVLIAELSTTIHCHGI